MHLFESRFGFLEREIRLDGEDLRRQGAAVRSREMQDGSLGVEVFPGEFAAPDSASQEDAERDGA